MPMYKIVIPFKDFLIVLSFIYLYFHQGRKMQNEMKRVKENLGSVVGYEGLDGNPDNE